MNCTVNPGILDQLARRAQRLYTLPAVAMQIVELTRQPALDARALKDCLEKDPALAAKVLRVVNSSLFGLSEKVGDLRQALALLGTKPLKLLVLGFSLPDELLSAVEADVLARYWRHTLIKATAAREISERLWELPGDEALLAGLLQDLGLLVLVNDLEEAYVAFLNRIACEGGDLAAWELQTLGFDHVVLSARLLEHWGLPETVVRAVALPQDADRLGDRTDPAGVLGQILHLAELIARFLEHADSSLLSEALDAGRRYGKLTFAQLESLVASLEEKVPQLAEVLSLQLPGDASYSEVLLEAYRQLSATTEDLACEKTMDVAPDAMLFDEQRALHQALERCLHNSRSSRSPSGGSQTRQTAAAAAGHMAPPTPPAKRDVRVTDDMGLMTNLSTTIRSCRQMRQPLTLLLADIDHYDTLLVVHGVEGVHRLLAKFATTLRGVWDQPAEILQVGESRLAALLPGCDRQQGVNVARDFSRGVRRFPEQAATGICFSIGLASVTMPPRNFPTEELIEAAQRCLQGVQLSGGDGVKSIDIF
jgi:HD-like signal output (HDOD) protein/GGDEF domain-containing protein